MAIAQCKFDSPVGELFLEASEKGLKGIYFAKQSSPLSDEDSLNNSQAKILKEAREQLRQYFNGKRTEFDIPLDLSGTEFQKKVWGQLSKIPFGKTVSYAQIAQRVKNPKAVRAVGSANGRNPICIIVPCHRVISSDGSIGGYSGGLDIKRRLLKLEGVDHL